MLLSFSIFIVPENDAIYLLFLNVSISTSLNEFFGYRNLKESYFSCLCLFFNLMNDSWNDDDYNQLFVITADVDWAVVVLAAIWDVKSAFDHTMHLAKQLTKQVTDAFWFFFFIDSICWLLVVVVWCFFRCYFCCLL